MNYGDQNNPGRGRAQVPGSSGGYGSEVKPGGGSAGAGRAPVGRAPVGRAPVGRAPVGAASGGGAGGGAGPGGGNTVGRASVGRATVGRASVRGAAPVFAPPPRDPDIIEGPGGDVVRPPKVSKPGSPSGRAKRARRRNWILGAFAVFIMLLGSSVVGGTYFYDNVGLPEQLPPRQITTMFYNDGKTPMAKIGEENRSTIPIAQIPKHVQDAVIATEDKDFRTNGGVSYTGIIRAALNNITGGERQGASTITQQYARNIADLKGITASRKVREAIIAIKLSRTYEKEDILAAYLNTIYFGRQAYGIETASLAYFNKSAKDLRVDEGIVLAGLIKQPEGLDGRGSPYDGSVHPETAIPRWEFIRNQMVKYKFLAPEAAAELKYPVVQPFNPDNQFMQRQFGLDRPTGFVVHQVMHELSKETVVDKETGQRKPKFPDLKTGGYKIITTIDPKMQAAAEAAADPDGKDVTGKASPMAGQKANVAAAVVGVLPLTGEVVAYYGGKDGSKLDMAGIWSDPVLTDNDSFTGTSHPPGSTFKIYALGAAQREDISIDSIWDGRKSRDFPKGDRVKGKLGPITNAGTSCDQCPLWKAVEQSMNTTFYAVAERVGAPKVIDFARAAGIRHMWGRDENGNPKRIDLTSVKSTTEVSPKYFQTEVGIGQYPITVLDHANGMATMAARGKAAKARFVKKVFRGADLVHGEQTNPSQISGYTKEMADDAAFAMQKVLDTGGNTKNQLTGNRDAAVKTGTWQLGDSPAEAKENAHAWMVGYTAPDPPKKVPGLAAAVWVGSNEKPFALYDKNNKQIQGASLPGDVWKRFMDNALKGTPNAKFPAAKHVGDDTKGEFKPSVIFPPNTGQPGDGNQQTPCLFPGLLCPSNGPGNGNNNGGNNGNGNGNGNRNDG